MFYPVRGAAATEINNITTNMTMKTTFNPFRSGGSLLALSALLLAAAGAVAFGGKPAVTPPVLALDDRPVARDARLPSSFSGVVKKVGPSVVKVYTATAAKQHTLRGGPDWFNGMPPGFNGMPPGFFRMPQGRNMPMPRQQGVGSGVIVTEDGFILTNNHVVDGADEVKVALPDRREFNAKVIGKDPKTDIAVLKIDAKGLPALVLADSDRIEVGDLVLAVGNPFNVGQTVTLGMVSAKGRGGMGLDYEDFIQTDAAINPGNSGGALVDTEGRLVGINTAILSRSGGNQGIGFAIPSALARDVMDNLVRNGHVARSYLGVMIQDVTPALAREFHLKDESGALVGDVVPGSPADKAGLKSGDVILELAGKTIADSRSLKLQAALLKPGQAVQATFLRDGKSRKVSITPQPAPGSVASAGGAPGDSPATDALHGVAVVDLDAQTRAQFEIPRQIQGAVIVEVEPGTPSAEAGLAPGDVIIEINRTAVRNAADATRLTANPKDKATLVRVWRAGSARYIVVDESKAG